MANKLRLPQMAFVLTPLVWASACGGQDDAQSDDVNTVAGWVDTAGTPPWLHSSDSTVGDVPQVGGPDTSKTAEDGAQSFWDTENCRTVCDLFECGPDGCGGSCGECAVGQRCVAGQCEMVGCVPQCEGKQCGPNGCGDICGACTPGKSCVLGLCTDGTCSPNCTEKQCGDDGCGGNCGNCPQRQYCDNFLCQIGNCTPDCKNSECGDDGCGGSCGGCPTAYVCDDGACVQVCEPKCFNKQCGPNGCGGSCGMCTDGSVCTNAFKCEVGGCSPQCAEAECGPDGCGGSCGQCSPGYVCDDGTCKTEFGGCEPTDQPGCNGCVCESCVCGFSPSCCTWMWTEDCANFCAALCGHCK